MSNPSDFDFCLDLDKRILTFGKYRGHTPNEVADMDYRYIIWMYETVKPCPCSRSLYLACRDIADEYADDFDDLYPHDEF